MCIRDSPYVKPSLRDDVAVATVGVVAAAHHALAVDAEDDGKGDTGSPLGDAPPPPGARTNPVSDGAAAPREAVELCGICMLIEHMMANPPPGAGEPEQLSAFWATTDAMASAVTVPSPNVVELHDFLFRLFATTGHTPECSVLSFMYILRLFSYHPHLRN